MTEESQETPAEEALRLRLDYEWERAANGIHVISKQKQFVDCSNALSADDFIEYMKLYKQHRMNV